MQRFFLPELLPKEGATVSLALIHNQLQRVLRVQVGAQLLILDNAGNERLMEIVSAERRETTARVVEIRAALAEPVVPVTLYQSILKIDKFELVLQKATELGVTTFVPVISRRTVARPGAALANKQARWESIVREAAEQSGRGGLPVVAPVVSMDEAIANAQGTRLLPWEEGAGSVGLLGALAEAADASAGVSILIGPEGGFEAGEVEAAQALGWRVVSLGARILRAETAAIAALSLVTAALGGLGDTSMVKVPKSVAQVETADAVDGGAETMENADVEAHVEAHVEADVEVGAPISPKPRKRATRAAKKSTTK